MNLPLLIITTCLQVGQPCITQIIAPMPDSYVGWVKLRDNPMHECNRAKAFYEKTMSEMFPASTGVTWSVNCKADMFRGQFNK